MHVNVCMCVVMGCCDVVMVCMYVGDGKSMCVYVVMCVCML